MNQGEGGDGPVGLAFLEVPGLAHLVGDMGKAEHSLPARLGEGIERRRLHLDRDRARGGPALGPFRIRVVEEVGRDDQAGRSLGQNPKPLQAGDAPPDRLQRQVQETR